MITIWTPPLTTLSPLIYRLPLWVCVQLEESVYIHHPGREGFKSNLCCVWGLWGRECAVTTLASRGGHTGQHQWSATLRRHNIQPLWCECLKITYTVTSLHELILLHNCSSTAYSKASNISTHVQTRTPTHTICTYTCTYTCTYIHIPHMHTCTTFLHSQQLLQLPEPVQHTWEHTELLLQVRQSWS